VGLESIKRIFLYSRFNSQSCSLENLHLWTSGSSGSKIRHFI